MIGTEGDNPWRFTGVYGGAEHSEKLKTCYMIRDIQGDSYLPVGRRP